MSLKRFTKDYLHSLHLDKEEISTILLEVSNDSTKVDFSLAIENLRKVLSVFFILREHKDHSFDDLLAKLLKRYRACLFWTHSALVEAFFSLFYSYLGQQSKSLAPLQVASAYVPLETKSYETISKVPHTAWHAELGSLYFSLFILTNDQKLLEKARAMVFWQLNTLDEDFLPFSGLYQSEKEGSLELLLHKTQLFFHAAAIALESSDYEYIAKKQKQHLKHYFPAETGSLGAYEQLFTRSLESLASYPLAKQCHLESNICDPYNFLIGRRSSALSAVTTACGFNSGLGSLQLRDVAIVSYGPQRLPLGDCKTFGLEQATCLSFDQSKRKFDYEFFSNGYRVSSKFPLAGERQNQAYLDFQQDLKGGELDIKARILSKNFAKDYAFCFYIRAKNCKLAGGCEVPRRSLERYQGELRAVEFEAVEASLFIQSSSFTIQELQIIPLSGEQDFWTSDYLLVYILGEGAGVYEWQVSTHAHYLCS